MKERRHGYRPFCSPGCFKTEEIVEVLEVFPPPQYWGRKKSPATEFIRVVTVDLLTGAEHKRDVSSKRFLKNQPVIGSSVAVSEGEVTGIRSPDAYFWSPLNLNKFSRRR